MKIRTNQLWIFIYNTSLLSVNQQSLSCIYRTALTMSFTFETINKAFSHSKDTRYLE